MARKKHSSDFNYINENGLPSQLFRFYFLDWRIKRGAYKKFKIFKSLHKLKHVAKSSRKIQEGESDKVTRKQGSSQISIITKKFKNKKYLEEKELLKIRDKKSGMFFLATKGKFKELPIDDYHIISSYKCLRGNLNPFFEFAESNGIIFSELEKGKIEKGIFENKEHRTYAAYVNKDIFLGITFIIYKIVHNLPDIKLNEKENIITESNNSVKWETDSIGKKIEKLWSMFVKKNLDKDIYKI